MALDLGVMGAAVTLDDGDYNRKMNGLPQTAETNLKKIARLAATYLSARALWSFTSSSVKAFSDMEEAGNRFDVVYGKIRNSAQESLGRLREEFGLSAQSAQDMLASTGDLLTGFGFGQRDALSLAEATARLGVDLYSFTNYAGGAKGATEALTKAMLGETEQMKALGVVIRQDSQEYQDLVKMFMETRGVSLQQAKALTALEIATKQSLNAIGDWNRPGRTFAQVTQQMTQTAQQFRAELGEELQGPLKNTISFIGEWMDAFNKADPVTQRITMRVAAFTAAMILLNTATGKSANLMVKSAAAALLGGKGFAAATTGVKAFFTALGPIGWAMIALTGLSIMFDRMGAAAEDAAEKAKDAAEKASSAVQENAERNRRAAEDIRRLEELSRYERLNNSEMTEAERLLNALGIAQGEYGASLDKTTGKLILQKKSLKELIDAKKEEIKQSRLAALQSQLTAARAAIDAATARDNRTKAMYGNGSNRVDIKPGLSFTVDQFGRPNVSRGPSYNPVISEEVKKLTGEYFSALREMQKINSSGYDPEDSDPSKAKERSQSERAAAEALARARLDSRLALADVEEKAAIMDAKLTELKAKQFEAVGNREESTFSEEELKRQKEITELERDRLELKREQDEIARKMRDEEIESQIERNRAEQQKQIDRKIAVLERDGDEAGVRSILDAELAKAKAAAATLARAFEAEMAKALPNGITKAERESLDKIKSLRDKAFAEEQRWADKVYENDFAMSGKQQKVVGDFSAALLAAMIGANDPAKETAKNTKESAITLRKIEQKTSTVQGIKYS